MNFFSLIKNMMEQRRKAKDKRAELYAMSRVELQCAVNLSRNQSLARIAQNQPREVTVYEENQWSEKP